jgi:tetratricopeptide (TPR) repeat protein
MGLLDFIFGKKKLTLEEADKINDAFTNKFPDAKDDRDALTRKATKSLTSGNFNGAIEIYTQLSKEYPENNNMYFGQKGAAYYFLGEYGKAIEFYEASLKNNGDESMMDDNIWEATEALFKQNQNRTYLLSYIEKFPNGNHKRKAEKLL